MFSHQIWNAARAKFGRRLDPGRDALHLARAIIIINYYK